MTIDERLEAVAMNLELLTRDVQDLKTVVQKDGENIRTLAGIAQTLHDSIKMLENIVVSHGERLDKLEEN